MCGNPVRLWARGSFCWWWLGVDDFFWCRCACAVLCCLVAICFCFFFVWNYLTLALFWGGVALVFFVGQFWAWNFEYLKNLKTGVMGMCWPERVGGVFVFGFFNNTFFLEKAPSEAVHDHVERHNNIKAAYNDGWTAETRHVLSVFVLTVHPLVPSRYVHPIFLLFWIIRFFWKTAS